MSYILDASAILALIKKEKGYKKVDASLDEASPPFIHAINKLEVEYKLKQIYSPKGAKDLLEWIEETPIVTAEFLGKEITDYARYLKTNYPLSLGDSIGLGFSKFMNLPFLTADRHELLPISKKETVHIEFFR